MNAQTEQLAEMELSAQSVAEYLSRHPGFFEQHQELLLKLRLPHQSGEAVSLVERQVSRLREQSDRYRQQLEQLIAVAKENQEFDRRLHQLTLSLIAAIDFHEVVNVLQDRLPEEFRAEAVELRLFSATEVAGETNPDLDGFRGFLDQGVPRCTLLAPEQLAYLFGPQAEDIHSSALVPITGQGLLGLLAFGSHDKHRFHSDMGTDYLTRLGEIVSRTLEVVSEPGV